MYFEKSDNAIPNNFHFCVEKINVRFKNKQLIFNLISPGEG